MNLEQIRTLTIESLKAKLREFGLPLTGNKRQLTERLTRHFGLDAVDVSEDEFSDANGSSSGAFRQERSSRRNPITEGEMLPSSTFKFRDLEDAIPIFTGESIQNVNEWLDSFEDNCDGLGFNQLQKFVFARRLMSGSAKLFIQSERGIRDWVSLRAALQAEFEEEVSSAEVHRRLRVRRKQSNETELEYLYRLMEIARPIQIDDASLIDYFIAGLKDDKVNKIILYEARTINELKQKLKIYGRIRQQAATDSNTRFPTVKREVSSSAKPSSSSRKCFRCGDESHLARDCKAKIKCFKCGVAGHKANECKVQPKVESKAKVSFGSKDGHLMKDVLLMDVEVTALIDTGCDLSLLRRDMLISFPRVVLEEQSISLLGLGNKEIMTIGYFDTTVTIDRIPFNVRLHVVHEREMQFSMVVGVDVIDQAVVCIKEREVRFWKKKEVSCEEEKQVASSSRDMRFGEGSSSRDEKLISGTVEEIDNEARRKVVVRVAGRQKEDILMQGPTRRATAKPDFVDSISGLREEFLAMSVWDLEDQGVSSIELSYLPETYRERVRFLIKTYRPKEEVLSPISMKIVLKDETPIYERARRLALPEKEEVDRQVSEWLKKGIIQESNSEFASPVVLVSKKNGNKRMCCDFRRINARIVKDQFPMPLIDDVVEQLQHGKVFTTLDLVNGFFHVPVEEGSRKYTSFVVHNGQYEFLKVPFGLCNSPAVFTKFIMTVLKPLIKEGIVHVYMDDVIIPASDYEDSINRLGKVLKVAAENGLEINWAKCKFLKCCIDFLGYIIEGGTIRPSEEKTNAVKNYPLPKDKKALQRFLGLTSYFRRFVEGYALRAKPLSDLLRKNEIFEMRDEQVIAFEWLKNALVGSPVLKLFDPKAETEIHTDASMYGYGAVLLQRDNEDREFHPVQFMSRKTLPREEKFHSYDLEVLAIVEALKRWRIYVLGKHIKIVTDCNAFAMTMKKKDVPLRVSRWALFLQDFDYEIEHRSGTRMRHVDALSRLAMGIVGTLTYRIKEAQEHDERLRLIVEILKVRQYEDYFIKNGILYKDDSLELIVIPASMEDEIIKSVHREGHFATKKTQDLLEKSYFIQDVKSKIARIIRNCVECILAERKGGKQERILTPIDKGSFPLETFHIDHIGPMEETKKKYNHILVVVDAFSKFVWLYPTKGTGTEEVLERLRKQAATFGNPRRIISDRGTGFTSGVFETYCKDQDILHLVITTGVPRGNGQVERINRILVPLLTKMSVENPGLWYKNVDRAQQLINNTPPRSTGITPFRILTGVEMRTKECPNIQELLNEEIFEEFEFNRGRLREEAKMNIGKIQDENYRYQLRKRKEAIKYNVNDLVAVRRTQFGPGLKLKPKYFGPYKISRICKHDRYEVEKVGDHSGPGRTTAAADGMKPWIGTFGSNV